MKSKIVLALLSALISFSAMADTKISALPAGAALTGTEPIPAVQSGSTVATTPAAVLTYVNANAAIAALQVTSGTLAFGRLGAFSGDCTTPGGSGVLTCTKTNGVAFAPIATSGSASDLSAGTVAAARMPALTGDVTSSAGSVATTIAVGAVTDAKASLLVKPSVTSVCDATCGNITLSGAQTIDGQACSVGASIELLTAQTTGSQNGPWTCQTGAWTRPSWYPTGGTTQALTGSTSLVRNGTVYGGSLWKMTTTGAITIDTTSQTWAIVPLQVNASSVANGVTGSGTVVLATSPTLVTPALGTPSAINLGNATNLTGAATPAYTGDTTKPAGSTVTTVKQIHDNLTALTNAASPYTVVSTDSFVTCDASSGVVTINLPAATGSGREIAFKKLDSSANACTPTRNGTDTIDGATSYSLTAQYVASKVVDTASGVWSRAHVNQLAGDVTGASTANTVAKVNGNTPGGTCTNQAVTSLSSSAVPTCTTLTSAYVDTSIAKTGTDINTSNQVTATHLAAAQPVNQGGTGTTSTLTGLVRGNSSAMTAAELSGDATTSGSNAVTVTKLNGTALSGLATGILKNTTGTGVPSIAVASDITALTPGAAQVDRQVFTSSGTWTKPTGTYTMTHLKEWGAGGGGGGGITTASGTSNSGGGGGASGGFCDIWIPTASLGSTETVTIGAAGTAGTAGGAGGIGGNTSFGTTVYHVAGGGGGGGPGQSNAVSGGGGGGGFGGAGASGSGSSGGVASSGGVNGGAGAISGITASMCAGQGGTGGPNGAAGVNQQISLYTVGGAAGAGVSATPTTFVGGNGSHPGVSNQLAFVGGGANATTGTAGAGGSGANPSQDAAGSSGAGGGSATTGTAGAGGVGAISAGGGGGGSALTGGTAGAGGAGGGGKLIVESFP